MGFSLRSTAARNLLTYTREWIRLHATALIIALVLGFAAGAALAAEPPALTYTVGPGNVPTLTWSAPWASSCSATGGWTGTKAASGSQTLSAISATTTYGLSCASVADTTATLTWTAPTQYTDGVGLPASMLGPYQVYQGTSASNLSKVAQVSGLTTQRTGLAVGTHYFAVSATTTAGVESAWSEVKSKTIVAPEQGSASVTISIPRAPGLTVQQTVAYDVKLTGFKYVLGKAIGTVPLGTECHSDFELPGGYYRVERDAVSITAKNARSAVFVALCG